MDTSLKKITDNCCLPAEVSVDNSLASECLDIDYNSQAEVSLEEFHELETEATETEVSQEPEESHELETEETETEVSQEPEESQELKTEEEETANFDHPELIDLHSLDDTFVFSPPPYPLLDEDDYFRLPYNRNSPPPTPKYFASRKRCSYCNKTHTFFSRDHE